LIAVTIFVRGKLVVLVVSVSVLVCIATVSLLGIVSSGRLAMVRAHDGTLRNRDPFVEALTIDRDWAAVLFLSNVGLGITVIVQSRRLKSG
jgi:hypothetical protein